VRQRLETVSEPLRGTAVGLVRTMQSGNGIWYGLCRTGADNPQFNPPQSSDCQAFNWSHVHATLS
jgi:hypothetical protein